MYYDYKDDDNVQDIIVPSYHNIVNDIVDGYYGLHRYEALFVYAPSYVVEDIMGNLLECFDEFWTEECSDTYLLQEKNNNVILSVGNDGSLIVENMISPYGKIYGTEDVAALVYVYDGLKKSIVDEITQKSDSCLIFGYCENDISCCNCKNNKCNCDYNDDEADYSQEYHIDSENDKIDDIDDIEEMVTDIDKHYHEFLYKYLQDYCKLMDEINDWRVKAYKNF